MTEWSFQTTRRTFLQGAAALGATGLVSGVSATRARAQEELTIFTWETYHDDEWLNAWGEKTGTTVNAIRTGSIDEMYAKLRSGAVEADIVYFDVGSMPRHIEANLISPIDPAKITNAGNISPGLDWQKRSTIDGKVWGVPYNWGTQPLMYNADVVQPVPTSWKVLWDTAYAGKVNLPDDAYITFPMIALSVGAKDPYNLTDEEFEKCAAALRELRPQIRTIARGFDDATNIYSSGDADLGYCQNVSSVFQLQERDKNFQFTFPDEGTPTWIDCAVLTPKGAERQVAYDFINDNLTLEWQGRFITKSINNGVLSSEGAVSAKIPAEVIDKTNIKSQEQAGFWNKMSILQNPENIDKRLELWNAFKAGTL